MKKSFSIIIIFQILIVAAFGQRPTPTDTLSPEKAIAYYESILKRNKKSGYAINGLASAYFVKGDYRSALKYSKQNIKSENEYQVDNYLIYACSLDRTMFYNDAVKTFEKAIKLFPNNDQLYYQYALTCYKTREFNKALTLTNKAITLQPLFVDAHYLNGCLLFESANNKQAVISFLYALMLDNDSIRAQQAIIFINEYIGHKPDNISIPFFDKRAAIASIDNIFMYYFPTKNKTQLFKDIKTELIVESIENYIQSNTKDSGIYSKFFDLIVEKNLTKAFSHYVVRGLGSDYIRAWYKVNAQPLKIFADFLDKNLPGI
jgi:tetratricopeptide (TPR) repeat protein